MVTSTETVVIARPTSDAFAFTTDLRAGACTRRVMVQPQGMLRVVEPLIARRLQWANHRDVLKLKRAPEDG